MSDERENLSWQRFGEASRELAEIIAADGFEPDLILSIARGGLFLAGSLGYALAVKNLYVMNVEFSIYMENKRTGKGGGYYSAKEACNPPRMQPSNTYPFPPEPNLWTEPNYSIQAFYHTLHEGIDKDDKDFIVMEEKEDGKFHTMRDFLFPMLRPGDKIFLWETGQIYFLWGRP